MCRNFQIEMVLRCAIESQQQSAASLRYMHIPPHPSRLESTAQNAEEFLSYPQYISVAKQQTQFTNNIRQMIATATQDVLEHRHVNPAIIQQQQQQ